MVELYMLLLRYCFGRHGVLMTSVCYACPNSEMHKLYYSG